MLNAFRKRQQKKSAAAAAQPQPPRSPPTDYAAFSSSSGLPPRAGIFISSAPAPQQFSLPAQHNRVAAVTASPKGKGKGKGKAKAGPSSPPLPSSPSSQQQRQHQKQQQQQQQQQQEEKPSLDHVLPLTADFRQSLIMPHLTRRFTLLRAPDGSLVSPDAMRAHLRAQRARARAANLSRGPSDQVHFLTEDEENEIIEQLKAQARQEGRDFDSDRNGPANGADSWRSGYNAGTDGFGLWGTSPRPNSIKLSTLAESLGDFSVPDYPPSATNGSSPAWAPMTKISSFTGRSAERDHAYIRNVQRERNTSKSEEPLPPHPLGSVTDPTSSHNTQMSTSANEFHHQSLDTAGIVSTGVPDEASPGGPGANETENLTSTREPTRNGAGSKNLLNVPGLNDASHPRTSQDSNLLTTLSPEAFKRVSTALDEVFGLIASESGPPSDARAKSGAEVNHGPQRSSMDSDTISFTSAVSNVRAPEGKRPGSDTVSSAEHETAFKQYSDGQSTDGFNAGTHPNSDAGYLEQGRLLLQSPLPGPLSDALPQDHNDATSNAPDVKRAAETLVPSDSVQTIRGVGRDVQATQPGSLLPSQDSIDQHLSISSQSQVGSMLTPLSDRTSTATARDAQPSSSRVVSTASTINGPQQDRNVATSGQHDTAAQLPNANKRSLVGAMLPPAAGTSGQARLARLDHTPEMTSSAFFASPAQSTLSRGDSIVSGSSVRSSLTGPSGLHQSSHSRKSSADKLALARAVAPHPHLRDQPSLSSVRRNYRQHTRSATGSSEGSLFGAPASRRSSGAMSPPPLLSRSARSPNYFPTPSSGASMQDYASGFKPPSAISPAAAAALQSMTGLAHLNAHPTPSSVMDASTALRSAQNVRSSTSTGPSLYSPQVPSVAAFASGSDRAAASSSPETGATSASLHHRNASLNSAKQQPQAHSARISTAEDGLPSTLSAPSRPAPNPELHVTTAQPSSGNEYGQSPVPPADSEQAERWRANYGNKAIDSASLGTSVEDVLTDPNDEEDLWAKMALASDPNRPERIVSTFPPAAAEERLAGTGITFDQMASLQDRLILTANGGDIVPPLPVPRIQADAFAHDHQQQKFADAKSKGLASPNLVFGSEPNWSTPTIKAPTGNGINGNFISADHDAPMRRSFSSSVTQDPPVSPRAVMYDVTMSHRPTSPPLHSRNGSLSGLPSLLELNGGLGQRERESFSLSRAVEQASRLPPHTAFESPPIAEEPSTTHDSQYAVAASPVQQHPFNVGYTSPPLPPAELYQGNSFSPANVGDSPRHQLQTALPEEVWDRYGPQPGEMTPDPFDTSMSPDSSYLGADPSRLLDDVAAQTSAATRALKGTDDGVTPTPPFRTKSISRKKSFKKVSKQISSPQLISTTQKLDHTNAIPPMPEEADAPSKLQSGLRSHIKASPSRSSQTGSFGRSGAYFHRRRSSSFGHAATPDDSFGTSNGGMSGTPGSDGQSSGDRAAGVHPNHPYMNGGASSGSLSRLFSKIKSRKSEQAYGGATIEPFPPELMAAARASEHSSRQQQQRPQSPPQSPPQQPRKQKPAPATPEKPSLPPVERSTPWTLPRMPSSASSTDRTSSVRSPTSPVYTLPIDSTSMPRNKSKKKRNPIVLKRESEVILPGDPGYIPTAVIGRSPEQRVQALADERTGESGLIQTGQEVASPNNLHVSDGGGAQQEQSTDTTLERPSERMDYDDSRDSMPLAPLAPVPAMQQAPEAETPQPASPLSATATAPELASMDENGPASATNTVPTTTMLQQRKAQDEVDEATHPSQAQSRSVDARKSLRDTIVRRTIIIPGGLDFGDHSRRSLLAPSSSRKSRRFAASTYEPVPPPSGTPSKSFIDSPAKGNRAALPELGPEGELEQGASGHEESMSTFNSNATLHPDGSWSKRASGIGGSDYAGSLYDMYIGGGGENVEPESPGSDAQELPLPRRSGQAGRTARHIEVTERADGSVVWQVIAGLADRTSVYSDEDLEPRPRWSEEVSGSARLGRSMELEQKDGWAPYSEDSRSFFTRARAAPPTEDVFSLPHNDTDAPALGSDADNEAAKSPTRIVYHDDAQLASLLDVLANGKDSAKFEFHLGPSASVRSPMLNSGSSQASQEWDAGAVVDGNDIESHRSRVEAEIYTLLNRRVLEG